MKNSILTINILLFLGLIFPVNVHAQKDVNAVPYGNIIYLPEHTEGQSVYSSRGEPLRLHE
jgi:hypothetical protein